MPVEARYCSAFFAVERGSRVYGWPLSGSWTSQKMISEVCAANGSSTAVEQSGASIMSESLIAFQPAIDEPSNMTPSFRKSSVIVRTWCARCCHLPRGSVKRKSTYLTARSLIISMTFWVSDIESFHSKIDMGSVHEMVAG